MVIPPLSFVWNRKTIQTEVGFRLSGGKPRLLKRTLPHHRRKKNKISRFSMSKHQDRVGGDVEMERRVNFHSMGDIQEIELMVTPNIYTHTHTYKPIEMSPLWREHIVALYFSVAQGIEGSVKFPIKMPVSLSTGGVCFTTELSCYLRAYNHCCH